MKNPPGSSHRVLIISLLAVCLGSLLAPSGHAALIAEQEYNTATPGATFGFGGAAGNPPYNWMDTGTPQTGLTYNSLTTTGESRLISSGTQGGFSGGPLQNNSTYFISFLLQTSGGAGRSGLTLFANNFNDLNGNGTGDEIAEFGQSSGFVSILTGNYGSGTAFQTISSAIASNAVTNLYVIGVTTDSSSNTATLALYYDPVTQTGNSPLLTYSVGLPAFHLNNMRTFGSATWDEFRVGDTFADVTPGLAAVPEPASAALLVASLACGAVLLHKRAKVA